MKHLESVRQAVRERPAGEYCASDLIRCRVQTEPCDQNLFGRDLAFWRSEVHVTEFLIHHSEF